VNFVSEELHPDKLGAAIMKMPNGDLFKARPAMTDKERDEIWKHPNKYIGRMATIKYQELDVKTGIPRFGVLTRFRSKDDMD